jgi:hypothetical protein
MRFLQRCCRGGVSVVAPPLKNSAVPSAVGALCPGCRAIRQTPAGVIESFRVQFDRCE